MDRTINLVKTEIVGDSGLVTQLVYEPESDILDIYFGDNEAATGVELTNHILLRINPREKRAVSLTIRHLSVLTQETEYGPRSYQLENLVAMPEEPREMILSILTSDPVNQFLKITHIQNSATERIPFTYVEAAPLKLAA